jgi:hypothetical protein
LINEHSRRTSSYSARDEFAALIKELEEYKRNQEEQTKQEHLQQRIEEEEEQR